MGNKTVVLVLAAALAVTAVSYSLALSPVSPSPRTRQPEPVRVSSILFIGSPAGLAGDVLSELESQSGQTATLVSALSELARGVGEIDDSSVVVLQSEWLIGKVSEPKLLKFLEAILPQEAKIVAVGGSTSLLFEVLDQVREVFTEGRNPAYDDPPVAGYKLRGATAPDGTAYQGESKLFANSSDPIDAADSILTWR